MSEEHVAVSIVINAHCLRARRVGINLKENEF